jgi:prepilin-type processing-associated H-X9-DG protein
MSYITIDNITVINAELSNYCNAACPMCSRFNFKLELRKDVTNNSHTSLDLIKYKIGPNIAKRLMRFYSNGTYGDGSMNPECLEIYNFIRQNNNTCKAELWTNGGARNTEFWAELAKMNVEVTFHIDGLEDTNHLYRRNVNWGKLMANVQSYIQAGGRPTWRMFAFKHNQHQIEEARELSKKLKFKYFMLEYTSRWKDYDYNGTYRDVDKIAVDDYYLEKPMIVQNTNKDAEKLNKKFEPGELINDFKTKKITCWAYNKNHVAIYLMADGHVTPCCWIGDPKTHESQKLVEDYDKINLNKSTLDEILKSSFFHKLENGINGSNTDVRLNACYTCCGVN